jgi:uncharacterized LabA/DUF88 family protein
LLRVRLNRDPLGGEKLLGIFDMKSHEPMFYKETIDTTNRSMVFVDGENLAIRYGKMLDATGTLPAPHVFYEQDIFVWSSALNRICMLAGVTRKYYYTSLQGDEPRLNEVSESLKEAGIEAPRVFKKSKEKGSKRVDISLATDMLIHAARRNYEIATLVAGDEDYVPLVEAVQSEGMRVFLWFVEDGLSPVLRLAADRYTDLGELLFKEQPDANWR